MKSKVNLKMEIKTCNDCPYYDWETNTNEGNWEGTATCKKAKEIISNSSHNNKIPKWCPLREEK